MESNLKTTAASNQPFSIFDRQYKPNIISPDLYTIPDLSW